MKMAQQQKLNSHQVKSGSKHVQKDLKDFSSVFDSMKLATLVRVMNKIAQVRPVQS